MTLSSPKTLISLTIASGDWKLVSTQTLDRPFNRRQMNQGVTPDRPPGYPKVLKLKNSQPFNSANANCEQISNLDQLKEVNYVTLPSKAKIIFPPLPSQDLGDSPLLP
jgi:hypothetical protein